MGANFAPMAIEVYQRCLRIIDTINVAYISQSMEVCTILLLLSCHTYCLFPLNLIIIII